MTYIFKKTVDWSLLNYGFNIPIQFQSLIHEIYGYTEPGQKRSVKIQIEDEIFQATLTNIGFNRNNFVGHKDLLQIRYSPQSAIAKYLRSYFSSSFNYFTEKRAIGTEGRHLITLPKSIEEYISLESVDCETFCISCFTDSEQIECLKLIQQENELEYEISANELINLHDEHTGYTQSLQKIRRLNSSIGESLKKLYDFRCQITKEKIGEQYGSCVIEAHHIEYFTTSLNNDASNIIIVNPNFHRIIHKNKPEFDRENLCFRFPNGVVEKVLLDKHLKIKDRVDK